MQARTFGVVLLAAILSSSSVALGQQTGATRRLAVVPAPVGPEGKVEELYTESRALLIGVSRYDQGAAWPTLDSVSGELNDLKAALLGLGFDGVEQLVNPTGAELRRGVEGFIARYGYSPRARLVFYFSGHGYTLDSGRRGYFVPRDAPDPTRNEGGFRSVALSMDQVMTWARDLTARHVLFAFDSCFSGTVFRTREATVPKPISDLTAKRVRQFLSAGDAGEPVPARSVFTPTFVRALRGEADLDSDCRSRGPKRPTNSRYASSSPVWQRRTSRRSKSRSASSLIQVSKGRTTVVPRYYGCAFGGEVHRISI